MKKSIFRTVALYLLIQLCFIGILGTVNNVDFATIMAYGASSLVLHIALYLFLVGFRKELTDLDRFNPYQNKHGQPDNPPSNQRVTVYCLSSGKPRNSRNQDNSTNHADSGVLDGFF